MNDLFDITYGPQGSDCTGPYYITLKRECTVREFIEYWLSHYSNEWGYFGIAVSSSESLSDLIFGNPRCEYKWGKVITEPLPDAILDSKIKRVTGSGGWSNSDLLFYI